MQDWSTSLSRVTAGSFSTEKHRVVTIEGLLEHPELAIEHACLQNFAKITPQYPGLRAPLEPAACEELLRALSPMLCSAFESRSGKWSMIAWYSIVTCPPAELLPIQRLPHVDGTDPGQIAMMLYLHRTGHGGTAFFRHKSTGLEALTDESFPRYRDALQRDVARTGLPPAAYVTDGEPLFERTYAAPGSFNQAVFYRGNILHSGVIDNDAPLPLDPREGRLTINAFLRPPSA